MRKTKTSEQPAPKIAIVSTYVPRHCGLATFALDLAVNYQKAGEKSDSGTPVIVAMSNSRGEFDYPEEVGYEIVKGNRHDYETAADFINQSSLDLVSIQHEYGIFGGFDGEYIIDFMKRLRRPVAVTLHTVLQEPTDGQRRVLKAVCELATTVVIIAKAAEPILVREYSVDPQKIIHIAHGAPDLPFTDPSYYQESFGLTGSQVLMTFGHLGPSKGIEVALDAIALLKDEFPKLVYLIVGATHPELIRQFGEEYRNGLKKRIKKLGIENHVRFVNEYLNDRQVEEYLQTADVYLSPYPGAQQISSGPLAFAVAAGKAVVATPYVAAQEILADGRGALTPFNDAKALAATLRKLLSDPIGRVRMRKAAYKFGRTFTWENVGKLYRRMALDIMVGWHTPNHVEPEPVKKPGKLNWTHFYTLCDNTGMFQHAKFDVPNRNHGYCTDDNARAFIVAIKDYQQVQNLDRLPLMRVFLSFLEHAWNPEKRLMRNFMDYDRTWAEEFGSDDSQGRALWALGVGAANCPWNAGQRGSFELFHSLLPMMEQLSSPRSWAFAILGIDAYLEKFDGDLPVRKVGLRLAKRLATLWDKVSTHEWSWFEESLAYDNGRFCEAMIAVSKWTGNEKYRDIGLGSLAWLFWACMEGTKNHISLVGSSGWWKKGQARARFDQQPVDAASLVAAARRAFDVTRHPEWWQKMMLAHEWFLGRNDLGLPLVDEKSGGCRDGLMPVGLNENMGAESTLSYMLASLDFESAIREHDRNAVVEIPQQKSKRK